MFKIFWNFWVFLTLIEIYVFGMFSYSVFLERIDSFSFFGSETLFCYQITMTSKMGNFIAKRLSENLLSSRLLGMKVLSTASTIVI